MGLVPLVLVLSAAGAHASWNLIVKRSGGGLAFVWLCALADVVIYAVPAAIQGVLGARNLSWSGVGFMVGSGLLHVGYFGALQRGYVEGDLSLVYPLARGTGPLLSVIAAIVILREHASVGALAGAALTIAAILSLSCGAGRERQAGSAVGLAVITGAFTAAYTVWDAHAVTALHQPVIVYFWGAEVTRTILLAPWALRRQRELRTAWSANWRGIVGFGILSPLAYILVLVALTRASVVFVAPAREISIVFGILLGANVLGEGRALQRALAGVGILAGIVLLALA